MEEMCVDTLRWPFTWKERQVAIAQRVLFVPKFCTGLKTFVMPPLSSLFDNDFPIKVEFCSGNGEWIAKRAFLDPKSNWIAVEQRFDRLKKIWSKSKKENLANLFLFCAEAYTVTHHFLKDETVDEMFINFPDPWPKRRHAKHRLIQKRFLDEISRVLKKEKSITFVTDDLSYIQEVTLEFKRHPYFKPILELPHFSQLEEGYGSSFFESLWKSKGKSIYTATFQKI